MGDPSFRPSDARTYDHDLSQDYVEELENEMTKGAGAVKDVEGDVQTILRTFNKNKEYNEFERMLHEGNNMPLKQRPSDSLQEKHRIEDLW